MVEFASWKDAYLFMRDYGSFTCLQCRGSHHNLDLSKEDSDLEYARFFCTKMISMVRLDFQFTCASWENYDGETLKDRMDECMFSLPTEVIEKLEKKGKKWTINEVRELVEDYEEVKE